MVRIEILIKYIVVRINEDGPITVVDEIFGRLLVSATDVRPAEMEREESRIIPKRPRGRDQAEGADDEEGECEDVYHTSAPGEVRRAIARKDPTAPPEKGYFLLVGISLCQILE
ncbi:hypothetical protein Q7P36_011354 [Cladosporium allicinum]